MVWRPHRPRGTTDHRSAGGCRPWTADTSARRANHNSVLENTCQARRRKIFFFSEFTNRRIDWTSPHRHKGRFAIVTKRGAGCDGRGLASGRFFLPDETPAAHGEIAGAWRRDRGVYPFPSRSGNGNGDKNRRSPGRLRISRKAIARGKPGCPGCTCQTRVHFLLLHIAHGSCGCRRHPAFPAPSRFRGPTNWQSSGENRAVRTRAHGSRGCNLLPEGRIPARNSPLVTSR